MRAALIVLLLAAPALSGCAALEDLFGPAPRVQITDLAEGEDAWNRHNRFTVRTPDDANLTIRITATPLPGGTPLVEEGLGEAAVELPDGSWSLRYDVDGKKRGVLSPVRIDTTAPAVLGLETVGDAEEGAYLVGANALVPADVVRLEVIDLATGRMVADRLPASVSGLGDGLHPYRVAARDEAGNWGNATVQVRSGAAVDLPGGAYTYGVVARYTTRLRLWDLTRETEYVSRPAAQAAVAGHLGAGFGIEPQDPAVEAVVAEVVTPGMNTLQAARALFAWMADHLDYDESRLDNNALLRPAQVLGDTEDPTDEDADEDGLVRDGPGNGVRGGVCRDLAATYVSLLRAAGVPARLVSGYVGGSVNGFHAWVEFYGGAVGGQDPWVPVDVSPIDGAFSDGLLLQAFGIELPDYLPLRVVTPESEVAGWSTAVGIHFEWPSNRPKPQIRLEERVVVGFDESGVLCLDAGSGARLAAADDGECGRRGFPSFLPHFLLATERTLDYGVQVDSAPAGTRITAEVAYPEPADVQPDQVAHQFYGEGLQGLSGGKVRFEDTV